MLPACHTAQGEPIRIAEPMDSERRQWAMLVPAGHIKTKDSRGPFQLKNAEAVIAASFAAVNTGSLPVDVNHSIDIAAPEGKPSPAAGWITRMEARKDGIWGLIEWTPNAAKAINEREYRFLSPVIIHTPGKEVKAILRASLTNNPNFTLTALNAAQKGSDMDNEELLKELRAALDLATEADGAAILGGVKALVQGRNSADPAQFVSVALFQQTVAELHKLRSGISLQAAEREVEQAIQHGKLLPFMREWAVSLCQANKAAFNDFLEGAGKPVGDFIASMNTTYKWPSPHEKAGGEELSEVQRNLGHSAEDVKTYGGKAE